MIKQSGLPIAWSVLAWLVFSSPSADAQFLDEPHQSATGGDCNICHGVLNAGRTNVEAVCLQCHAEVNPPLSPATPANIHASHVTGSLRFTYSNDCVSCHDPHEQEQNETFGTSYGKYIKNRIIEDITVTDLTQNPPVTTTKFINSGQLRFTSSTEFVHNDPFFASICRACHTLTNHHRNELLATGPAPGGQDHNNGTDCTQCHGHLAGFAPTGGPPAPHNQFDCNVCHTEDAGGNLIDAVVDAPIANSKCEGCHGPGTPDMPSGGSDIKVESHFSNKYIDPTTGQLASLNCVECHNPMRQQVNFRNNTNLAFIRSVVRGNTVVFEATTGPYSFAYDLVDRPADMSTHNYICNTCHTQTNHHRTDGSAPTQAHNDGLDCTGCHGHIDGFRPVGSGNCLACHNQSPPVGSNDPRRDQIVEGQPGDGGGDFVGTSHHVINGPASNQVVTPGDCLVCHDQASHQSFGDGVSVLLNDQNGGPSYIYNGQALTAEAFCLSCHDGNHPTPFPSDVNSPLNIAGDWGASTHAASGFASCLDCHAQGHGSDFEKILPEANEPGFCYNCHGVGGPGDDIEGEFAKQHRHPVEAFNSQVQCLDCHNPHKATADNKIAGVSGVTVKGALKSTNVYVFELCLKCHTDKQREFDPNAIQTQTGLPNTAYHAVAAPGRSISQALFDQLQGPFNLATKDDLNSLTIQCTDCHNSEVTGGTVRGPVTTSNLRTSDKPSRYTGTAPTGPHGSTDRSHGNSGEGTAMLRDNYRRDVGEGSIGSFNASNFALCFRCHDSGVFTSGNNNTRFDKHEKHVRSEEASCATCHWNTHSNVDAANTNYIGLGQIGASTMLINFAPGVVQGNNFSKPTWGYFSSEGKMGCDLVCHGKDHGPKDYDNHPNGDYVSGPGTDQCDINVAPLALDFGAVNMGSTATLSTIVGNNGAAPCTIDFLGINGSPDFALNAGAPSVPFSVAPGATVPVAVDYTPTNPAADAAILDIVSDDLDEPDVMVSLDGTVAAAPADILVGPLALDFGSVTVGATSTLMTTINNTGGSDLTVTGLTVTGSGDFILGAGAPATPFTVAPGALVDVPVDYTPSAVGAANGTLTVASDDADEANVPVALSGTGVAAAAPEIDVAPLSLAFGSVNVGATATLTTTISNLGSTTLNVTGLSVTGSADFALGAGAPATPFTVAAGGSVNVPVDYAPSAVGAVTGTLTIASDDADEANVPVALSGTGVVTASPEIDVAPLSLAFGLVNVGDTATLTTTISNLGGATLNVTGLSLTGSADFALGAGAPAPPFTVAAGGSVNVPMDYAPSAVGAVNGTLNIASDDADEANVPVALSGTGAAVAPEIDVAPLSLAFGTVVQNNTATLTATISNLGSAALNITGLSVTGSADFALATGTPTPPFTVAAGASVGVSIDYTPADIGADSGTLSIASDDADEPTVNVALSGTGVNVPPSVCQVAPLSLDFGAVEVGTSVTLTTTVTHTGTSSRCAAGLSTWCTRRPLSRLTRAS